MHISKDPFSSVPQLPSSAIPVTPAPTTATPTPKTVTMVKGELIIPKGSIVTKKMLEGFASELKSNDLDSILLTLSNFRSHYLLMGQCIFPMKKNAYEEKQLMNFKASVEEIRSLDLPERTKNELIKQAAFDWQDSPNVASERVNSRIAASTNIKNLADTVSLPYSIVKKMAHQLEGKDQRRIMAIEIEIALSGKGNTHDIMQKYGVENRDQLRRVMNWINLYNNNDVIREMTNKVGHTAI